MNNLHVLIFLHEVYLLPNLLKVTFADQFSKRYLFIKQCLNVPLPIDFIKGTCFKGVYLSANLLKGTCLRGGKGKNSWKHDIEITGDPKGPSSGSTFWSGFEALDLLGNALLKGPKIENCN